jgi:hypothetical protein
MVRARPRAWPKYSETEYLVITTSRDVSGATGPLSVRYFWESAGRSSFQGSTLFVALTLGRLP